MNFALVCHDPASGRVTMHELPTIAVIEPRAASKEDRMWVTSVTIRLADGSTLLDTDPGHAIMEVLGLYAEDEGVPRWRRQAEGMHVPARPETVIVKPTCADPHQPKPWTDHRPGRCFGYLRTPGRRRHGRPSVDR